MTDDASVVVVPPIDDAMNAPFGGCCDDCYGVTVVTDASDDDVTDAMSDAFHARQLHS